MSIPTYQCVDKTLAKHSYIIPFMQRSRIANIAFTALAALFFSSILAIQVACYWGASFPDWAGIGKTESTLEKRSYQNLPQPDLKSTLQGSFQTKVNKYLSDSTPNREKVLLVNAAMEHSLIEIANLLFEFDVTPTYFSSKYFFSASKGRLYPMPLATDESNIQRIETFVDRLNNFTMSKSSCGFSCYLGEYTAASANNPVSDYKANSLTHNQIIDFAQLHLNERIRLESDFFDDAAFEETHFLTDFHWNIYGAYNGYISIMRMLDQDAPTVQMGEVFQCDYPRYYGIFARGGLFLKVDTDKVVDCRFDLPEYRVTTEEAGDGTLLSALTPDN